MYLVGLIVKALKGAGVEHTHNVIKGAVIIRDNGKHSLLALSHFFKLHVVLGGDILDLRQDKGRQPHRCGNQDAFGRFARRLFVNLIFPHGDVIRVFLLQRFKQQI